MAIFYTDKGAILSADERYRFLLWREWHTPGNAKNWVWHGNPGEPDAFRVPRPCVFVMLNPSTADGEADDATIRKCVAYARRWDYERLEVVNLFAYRTTDPRTLLKLNRDDDPVGSFNQHYFERVMYRGGIIICAWGAHGGHLGQDETALGWLDGERCYALGLTKDGHPKHPLYLPLEVEPTRFSGHG